jgi:predicted RNA-binding Zn-ribbon protein involved in translation (DUF1610 family)
MDTVFSLMPRPLIEKDQTKIDWDRKPQPFFHIVIVTEMVHRPTGRIVGYGFGSCSSTENKYRERDAKRKCPDCEQETIFKSKKGDQPGWFCWAAKGGCGKQFKVDDPAIINQELGKVVNDDIQGLYNTILKMAKKRSHMDGVLTTCGISGLFDADDDDADDDKPSDDVGEKKAAGNGGGKTEDIGGEARQQLAEAFTKAGHKAADVQRWIQETHGFDMTKVGFPKAKFTEILDRVSKPEPLFAPAGSKAKVECLCPDAANELHLEGCTKAPAASKKK